MEEYLKEYRRNRSVNVLKSVKVYVVTNAIKNGKDDINYPPFVK